MPPNGSNKLSKVEELKNKLFSKNYRTKIEHRDNFSRLHTKDVMDSWTVKDKAMHHSKKFFMKTSLFKNFFVFSMFFLLLALGYGFYVFFVGGNTVSNNNIDITVLGNTFTAGGEELPLQIGITNKNTIALELVDLVVEYPKNSSDDPYGEVERIRESLGIIPSGAIRNENIKVILFGEQGSIRPIKITLEYRVEGSNAIFVKEKLYEVNINSTPINISINAPNEISPNQDIAFDVTSTLNATRSAAGMIVRIEYPVGFQFISAKPEPSFDDNVWSLGDLASGSSRTISIVGKMIDVFDGEEKTVRVFTGSQSKTDKTAIDVVFNSVGHTFLVKRPFIEASFLIAGVKQREYSIDSRSKVVGEIKWTNNLETQVNDLSVRAKISGNAIDRTTITPQQGFYNSVDDTITWDKNYISNFREISPGQSGSVFFTFSPLSLFSSNGVLNDPSIIVEVSIAGKQDISGYETQELRNSSSSIIKVISDVGFATKAMYYSGPFINKGPIPPKIEEETTYTITWSLSNSSNNIVRGVARSSLPAWMRFVGPVSPSDEDLTYNPVTRDIIWNVGNINKGVGITSSSREVSFQVAITPSLSQVGTSPVIINDAVLTGHDDFANVDIKVNKPVLYTRLTSDASLPPGGERVVE
ncbi:hypothetical protein COU49_00650 [Candidatus Nomurabacteria bacterium CG10_big_fil_rev_8_21_14_0_10_35_16]|uniref:DUF11 domain-containing protein n=1 Tax=Candidatus Nomurabacteria bacterium CG10_big_fil_rev_8_21_14_0_10_35_16 TaxID=1974731 RepID=A0A2H0TC24_9BACT|nr:MAG: hypothetical protein COU49_00650 [Candidatus Nomurabacteria bacterium CG10_big_fil_rev_8_21_14_0_10_35_16]